jgi:DNA-binding HxlR family transcriptional regulator
MPNQVTSHNERTLFKALKALTRDEFMSFDKASDALDRLMDAGLLIREPAEKEEPKKVYRGTDDKPQGATPPLKPTGE